MARYATVFVILFVCIFGLVQLGAALQCYTCEGVSNCAKAEAELEQETCPTGQPLCVQISDPKAEVTRRRCGIEDDCLVYSFCADCNSNLCNSSSKALPTLFTITLVAVTLFKQLLY